MRRRGTDSHVDHEHLVADSSEAKKVLSELGSRPVHLKGDLFEAKPRPNVAEDERPTPAQKRALSENIKKAQAARRS